MFWLFRRALEIRREANPEATTILRWQVGCWAIVMFCLSYIPPNAHSWYMIWAIPLVAIVTVDKIRFTDRPTGNRFLPNVAWPSSSIKVALFLFYAWSFICFFAYHTFYR
jgi:hypothetical protein